MIHPKSIEIFLAIAEHKSLSAVARLTNYSQPTISEYLRQLEDAIGTPLVLRGKGHRQISLTPAGEAFLPLAQKWIVHQKDLERQIRQFRQSQSHNSLRLAASSGAHQLMVSHLVYNLITRCPGLDIQLCNMERREISTAIDEAAFDIAFTFGEVPDSDLVTSIPIFREQAVILCPADTPLPNRVITPTDLDPHFNVLYSPHKQVSAFRTWYQDCFPNADPFASALGVEVSSLGAIHQYLSDPNSWAIVPASIAMSGIAQSPNTLTYRFIAPELPYRVCKVVISRAYKETAIIRAFLQCCDEFVKSHTYMHAIPYADSMNIL